MSFFVCICIWVFEWNYVYCLIVFVCYCACICSCIVSTMYESSVYCCVYTSLVGCMHVCVSKCMYVCVSFFLLNYIFLCVSCRYLLYVIFMLCLCEGTFRSVHVVMYLFLFITVNAYAYIYVCLCVCVIVLVQICLFLYLCEGVCDFLSIKLFFMVSCMIACVRGGDWLSLYFWGCIYFCFYVWVFELVCVNKYLCLTICICPFF